MNNLKVMEYKGATVTYTHVGEPVSWDYLASGYISFSNTVFDEELGPDDFGVPDEEILTYASLEEVNNVVLNSTPLGDLVIHEYELILV